MTPDSLEAGVGSQDMQSREVTGVTGTFKSPDRPGKDNPPADLQTGSWLQGWSLATPLLLLPTLGVPRPEEERDSA